MMMDEDNHWEVINDLWLKIEFKHFLRQTEFYKKMLKQIRDDAVIAAFKKNSSYFMRKDGDPLIFKAEGVTKDNIIDWIIMAGKALDEATNDYYIPYPPSWFEDAVDPL